MNIAKTFDKFSRKVTKLTGSYWAFIVACFLIIAWFASGPFFHFSDTWQLAINTGTTVVTFLMVFIIQQSSNKDTAAMQIKLDEIIRAIEKADNEKIGIEDLDEIKLKAKKAEITYGKARNKKQPKQG